MDSRDILELVDGHKYALVIAVAVGLVVRLLKTDTKIPIDVPSRYRKYLALALALVGCVVEKYASSASWKPALLDGLLAWFAAEWGQKIAIDDMRGGKELPVPGLMRPGVSPSPGKPPSVPPPPERKGPPSVPPLAAAALFLLLLSGCRFFYKALDLAADKAKCVAAKQDLPDERVWAECLVEDPERYLELLATSRAATRKALERQAAQFAAPTRVDAGAPPASDAGAEAAAADAGGGK